MERSLRPNIYVCVCRASLLRFQLHDNSIVNTKYRDINLTSLVEEYIKDTGNFEPVHIKIVWKTVSCGHVILHHAAHKLVVSYLYILFWAVSPSYPIVRKVFHNNKKLSTRSYKSYEIFLEEINIERNRLVSLIKGAVRDTRHPWRICFAVDLIMP